jgi:stage II sporulation protein D
MKQKLTGRLVIFLFIVMIPTIITLLLRKEESLPVSGDQGETSGNVSLDGEKNIDLQEYLIGITAAQMPGNYSPEAVKAQMILNRTYYYHVLGDRTNLSADELGLKYLTKEERTARWRNEGCTDASDIFYQAAVETKGKVMTCQRALAVGMYHPVSAGKTREFGEGYPYLRRVDSEWDRNADGYITVIDYNSGVLLQKINAAWGLELSEGTLKSSLQILKRDEAGYVEQILVGTVIVKGEELAKCLSLPSTAFSFQWPEEDRLSIVCLGQGHGYGMSQYGADTLAREGKTALQILQYYFQNVTIETWKRDE